MVRLTDRPDMTLDVYRGRKTTIQQQHSLQSLRPTHGTSCVYLIFTFIRFKQMFAGEKEVL